MKKPLKNTGAGAPSIPPEIEGLHKISPRDCGELKQLFTAVNCSAWCCFAPFLYFTCNPEGNYIYWTELNGTPVILYRKPRAKNMWELYTLCAHNEESAWAAIDFARRLNGATEVRISWLPEDQLKYIERMENVVITPRDSEYMIDSRLVAGLKGGAFRELRKRLNRFQRENPNIEIDELTADDAEACLWMHEYWKNTYTGRGYAHPLVDSFYTAACLENFGLFRKPDIFGWTAWRDDEIVGFSLAGEMRPGLANFFALKCDLDIRGLSVALRYHSVLKMAEMGFERINDASDLNAPGLARHKAMFNPVEKLNIYRASL